MPYGQPAQLANLRPKAPPDNTGKKYRPSLKRMLKTLVDVPFEDSGLTHEQYAAQKLLKDATSHEDANVRRQAIKEIWDRLYGRAIQPVKQSGTIQHNVNVSGKKWDELTMEECDAIIANPHAYTELPDGRIVEASFEDLTPEEPNAAIE